MDSSGNPGPGTFVGLPAASPSAGATPAVLAGRQIGSYEVVGFLGAGGMGEVYKAYDRSLDRHVALKLLPEHLAHDPERLRRFHAEARAASSLSHPHILVVHGFGDHEGRPFFVTELVEGQTLRERISSAAVSAGEAIGIATQVASALAAAHARGVLHRDIKPENVMVRPDGYVKLLDFGLARQVAGVEGKGARVTQSGVILGTLRYMSPEQSRGERAGAASDVFSLGLVLYEMIAGRHPFDADSSVAILHAIQSSVPTPSGGPPALDEVLGDMLQKSPSMRPTASDVVARLTAVRLVVDALPSPRPSSAPDAAPHRRRWPIVGREAEQAVLVDYLDATLAGRGGAVLIGGEPGIGKTRLAEELLADARRRGARGIVGHCYEMQGAPPYVPFVEMIEETARVVPAASLRSLLGDDAPEIARLMPELRRMFPDIPPPTELPPEQQRWHFFNAYRSFVERASRLTPVVAVFEDLHWADEPTLQLLRHLAPTTASIRVLLICTYRDVELDVSRPFAHLLETLLRERLATGMTLRRLSAPAVASLLEQMSGRPVPAALGQLVFRETEGNPFFVEEVFQYLATEGRLFASDGSWRSDANVEGIAVPEGVRLLIGRRLERLRESTRRVLETGAMLGRAFSLALLERIESGPGGTGADAVLEAIEEAQRAHLVTPVTAGRDPQFAFGHELIRQTLAEGLSIPRRQRLHGRIALAIETLYASSLTKHVSVLAHHLYQAGAAADLDRTLHFLVEASDQARAAAGHEEALGHLDRASNLIEGDRSERMGDLMDRRASVLSSLGQTREAAETRKQAAAIWRERADHERYAASMLAACHLLSWAMDIPAALGEASNALRVLEAAAMPVRVPLMYEQAKLLALCGLAREGTEMLQAADAACVSLGASHLDALGAYAASCVLWYTGRLDEARGMLRQFFDATAGNPPWETNDAMYALVWTEINGGRLEQAAALIRAFEPVAERTRHPGAQWALQNVQSSLTFLAGDLAGAARGLSNELEFGRRHGVPWSYVSQFQLGLCLFLQGRTNEALEMLRDAAAAEPPTWLGCHSRSALFRCLCYVAPDEARTFRRDVGFPLPGPGRATTAGAVVNLLNVVEGLHTLGDREALTQLVAVVEEFVRPDLKLAGIYAPPEAALALTAASAGRWEVAESHFRSVIALCDSTPVPVFQGTTREWYADMLMVRGTGDDRARARTLVAEAADNYEALGLAFRATRLAERRLRT